ncbi:MATE family efflux transporter [Halorussus salilacus]|uniref:MATE family efflux transporter n=1 Tax=Halorussus salilacus TaxID=2953750 RepID=UPI0020A03CE6|nr:MATE family efflux transporter [Halorussus salilacus]USZ67875.1 MATE family efflux transporter [Halorussus salilacus]
MSLRERLGGAFKDQSELDLTDGAIGWPLFYLSLPIVVTNLLQTAYNLADTFWLGQYSTESLAAISFAFPMVFLLISLGMGLSVAGSVLVAQHVGAGEERQAEYAASQTVTFSILASLVLGVVGYFLVGDFLALLGASPEVLPGAKAYMQVISLGIVFMFGFFVFVALMRGYGDTVTPMLVMAGTVALNVALDPFLIFGWGPFAERGIQGAAVATIASRALAMAVGLGIMLRGSRGVRIRIEDMRPDFQYLRKILRIGVPASVEGTGRALSVNLLLYVVALFPTTVVAAYGVGTRVFSVIFLPAIAVARGVETMSGQNIGAGKPDRAAATNHFGAKVMFVVLTAMGVVIWLAADPIVAVFTEDPEVVDVGATFLRYVAPSFGFIGVMRAYTGGFRGAGKTLTAAALSIFMLGVVRLPVAWFGAHEIGEEGIWVAFLVSNVVGGLLALAWFRRGTWRDGDLTEGPTGAPADD